jgi:hypothetical protein
MCSHKTNILAGPVFGEQINVDVDLAGTKWFDKPVVFIRSSRQRTYVNADNHLIIITGYPNL